MEDKKRDEWVVVAQFNAMDTGLAADMAVSKLQGSGIQAVRFPGGALTTLAGWIPAIEWIRVLVPPDQAEKAREVLAEEDSDGADTPSDS